MVIVLVSFTLPFPLHFLHGELIKTPWPPQRRQVDLMWKNPVLTVSWKQINMVYASAILNRYLWSFTLIIQLEVHVLLKRIAGSKSNWHFNNVRGSHPQSQDHHNFSQGCWDISCHCKKLSFSGIPHQENHTMQSNVTLQLKPFTVQKIIQDLTLM